MAEYAARTKIPAERTRLDIEAMMKKRGADQFFSGDDGKTAILAFRLHGRHIRFSLPLTRTAQQVRSRWRALWLVIKAKLEAIDIGILTLEDAFLSETVLPDRQTVAEYMRPKSRQPTTAGKCQRHCPLTAVKHDRHQPCVRQRCRSRGPGLVVVARPILHFTRTAIATAVAGARQGGVEVVGIKIAPDGTIEIITSNTVAIEPAPPEGEDPELRAAIERWKKP
jgi:hypothetical protein